MCIALSLLALWILPHTTLAAERIQNFGVTIDINEDASIDVREEITYDFGSNSRHGIFRSLPLGYLDTDNTYLFLPIEVDQVTDENGAPYEYEIVQETEYGMDIKIGDPDKKITGEHVYVIEYSIDNAINGFSKHDELNLNITGTGWDVPIEKVKATITLPGKSETQRLRCITGSLGSTTGDCDQEFVGADQVEMSATDLFAFEGLTAVIGFDKGLVELPAEVTINSEPTFLAPIMNGVKQEATTPARFRIRPGENTIEVKKFAYDPFVVTQEFGAGRTYTVDAELQEAPWAPLFQLWLPLFVLIAMTLGLFGYWNVRGRDKLGRGTVVPQYEEPEGLTAGELGVLADQKVHRYDISATLIQLAVRGYLHLEKLETKENFGMGKKNDYLLTKQKSYGKEESPELRPHERKMLKGIFGSKSEVKLSDLNNKFYTHLPKIKDDLYDSMVEHEYFIKHPDKVRRNWRILAIIGFMAANALGVAMTAVLDTPAYGAVGGLISVQVLVYSFIMPQRTKKGSAAHEHVLGLKEFMTVTEKERMKFHFDPDKITSSNELFERLLPYAIVLKVEEEWAKQFPELTEPDWYSGSGQFSPLLFTQSMSSFSAAAASAAVSTPSSAGSGGSGFSGGFSGGGFGGGGGGSW